MAYGQKHEARTGFYLAHDMSRLPIGAKVFANPPHITQCPPAEVDTVRLPEIHEFLAGLVGDTEPIALRSLGQAFFGRRDNPTLATQFEKPRALNQFHKRLIRGLAKAGCDFIGLEYALKDYSPHSEAVLLDPGVTITMDNLTLFAECRTPRFNGLDAITARYEFGMSAS